MPISMIVGKPGSGKSYFAVSKIAEFLCQCAGYEKEHGADFERKVYTNLVLDLDACDKYVKNKTGISFDSSKYLFHTNEEFFYAVSPDGRKEPSEWWEKFPNKALIVIDEVHQLIPAKGAGDRDFMDAFVNYISTHRHREQDIIFITQHSDNMHRSILSMATDCYQILNIKNRVLPWIGIPLADLDVVKEAFGIKNQVANVLYGNYVGRSFKKESTSTMVLSPEIYALYSSHTMAGGESSDRPSFRRSRIGAIFWFIRRHIFHLSIKAGLVVAVVWGIRYVLTQGPTHLAEAMVPGKKEEKKEVPPSIAPVVPSPPVVPSRIVNSSAKDLKERDFRTISGVYVFGKDFIIGEFGRVIVGEEFENEGHIFKLESVDLVRSSYVLKHLRSVQNGAIEAAGLGPEISEDSRGELEPFGE